MKSLNPQIRVIHGKKRFKCGRCGHSGLKYIGMTLYSNPRNRPQFECQACGQIFTCGYTGGEFPELVINKEEVSVALALEDQKCAKQSKK